MRERERRMWVTGLSQFHEQSEREREREREGKNILHNIPYDYYLFVL